MCGRENVAESRPPLFNHHRVASEEGMCVCERERESYRGMQRTLEHASGHE